MYGFLNDLTADERALLSHMVTRMLDREAPATENLSQCWDKNMGRISYVVKTAHGELNVTGFQSSHQSFLRPMGMNMSESGFEFVTGIANYQPEQLERHFEQKLGPAFAMLSAGRTNSARNLFDHPVEESRPIRLSLKDAKATKNEIGSRAGETRLRDGHMLWDISLSGDQYLRMLRGQYTQVPCTINRSFGYLHDEPDISYLEPNRQSQQVKREVRELTEELDRKMGEITALLRSGAVTTKKKLNLLSDLADEAEQCWKAVQTELEGIGERGIEGVKNDFKRRLYDQVEQDAKALSSADSQTLIQIINDI